MKITTGLKKIQALDSKIKIVKGGTYAGKTYDIIAIIINKLCQPSHRRKRWTVVAESIPAVKQGVLEIFYQQMTFLRYWKDSSYNATDRLFKFDNGNMIQFTSFDKVGKAKAAGKRDGLFINEINHIQKDICIELINRTDEEVFIDYNPVNEFWVETELATLPNTSILTITYRDNEALSKEKILELEHKRILAETSEYWANWCRVYLDGLTGRLEDVCIDNYKVIETLPPEAKLLRIGLDFGFHPDPNAAVALYQYNGKIIADEILYRTNMNISELVSALKPLKTRIICDSSSPLMIDELKRAGIYATGAKKGKDSVVAGIAKLNERGFLVTKKSINLIKELRNYVWKDGLPNGEDHAIDALRYGYTYEQTTIKSQII